jgi:demethoxyubiquinone hydroxylase (CLK1/Coq7/Cat5 family)
MRRGVSTTAEGGGAMRFLWFTAGFLLGVVTTTLGLLWMMTMAVVA